MKSREYLLLGTLVLLLSSCSSARMGNRGGVVQERFYHTYGVEIPEQEWTSRGKSGTIQTVRDNGVTEKKTYLHGILDGVATYTFPHSNLVEIEETYEAGHLKGRRSHYACGSPRQEEKWSSDGNRLVKAWYEDGLPLLVERYQKGLLTEARYYTPSNEVESSVVAGEGIRVIRDRYGQKMAQDEIALGEMTLRTLFYASGAIKSITPYVGGKIEGTRKTFLPDGEPIQIEEWRDDRQEGLTALFENGVIVAKIPYQEGQKHGIEKRYDLQGSLVEEITWDKGMRQGPSHIVVGEHIKTEWYYEDQLVSKAGYELQMRPFVY